MSVFEILMAPFLFLVKQFFSFAYDLTDNYGISIIVLSFFISLILLPVFIVIERAKRKDDAIKLRMKPFVDEIKRCYKGQERYYYLKTLNRQFAYSPVHALIPVLSLLLQIPFFIAAYQFLAAFEPLKELGFLFIPDLSEPDGVLGGVNLLPFLMTIVNLLTAYFYTRHGSGSERNQMLVVAVIFLVLLFKLPSGLVLYWTMNNVFSFLRLFITNPEVFSKATKEREKRPWSLTKFREQVLPEKPQGRNIYLIITSILLYSQVNWALQNNSDDIVIRLLISVIGGFVLVPIVHVSYHKLVRVLKQLNVKPVVYFSFLFLSVYTFLAGSFYHKQEHVGLIGISIVLIVITELIATLYFFRSKENTGKIAYSFCKVALVVIFVSQVANLLAYISNEQFSMGIFNAKLLVAEASLASTGLAGLVLILLFTPYYIRKIELPFWKANSKQKYIVGLSILYIGGLVFFWNPMIVYASYPDNFNFPAIFFVKNNFFPFAVSFFIAFSLYGFTPKRFKQIWAVIFAVLALIAFLYSSIIPFDVGTLQISFFSKDEKLAMPLYYYLADGVIIYLVIVGVIWAFRKQFQKHIVIGLVFLNLFLIVQSLILVGATGELFSKQKHSKLGENEGSEISFSKTEENVLIFVIDGAQGWYMHDIVAEDSSLKTDYNGFTYYPNSLAMGNYTYASVPSMMCGFDYSISNMNADDSKTIIEKVTDATELFYQNIKDRGYYFTSTILRYSNIDHNKIDNYIPKWDEEWTRRLELGKPNEMWYTRLWENALFSCSPFFLKPRVYNNRKWIVKDNENINSSDLQKYNFVRVLPQISNAKSSKKNFIYIHSLFTHTPWDYISDDNKLTRTVSPYKNQQWFTYTFVKWLEWMKENDVYDNTKIILVSDHGPSWWHYEGDTDPGTAPIVWSNNKNITLDRFLHLNPLLLVKDFNAKGQLKEDWRLMSNADVHAIAFNKENDPTKHDLGDRLLPAFTTQWHTDLSTRTQYVNKAAFLVKDNVYDLNNWEEVEH